MKTKIYTVETVFDGAVIDKTGSYIAIPNKFKAYRILARYNGEQMVIEKWLNADAFRRFPDKWGRKNAKGDTIQYVLGYFKWQPQQELKVEYVGNTAKII